MTTAAQTETRGRKPSADPKTDTLTLRITPETKRLLTEAQSILPYQPTLTGIVERGIMLAIQEMREMAELLRKAA
ncbi:hypothetical protein EOA64_00250 [Mesorhizobium sp. M1A.F.Ca.IN.022.02.1.1]|uniref:hypothetical protein n=1 Tax=Mesorhizobium sp. M1A.F.Ca.IN.022.02.1.1 TaxID=2496766 RepID=UPI000FCC4DE0|nr:hypothetical protein [Mesorhizobium sp. M1A.F.Ca.IN.022.02.1.1]RUV65812.1 hypothetical protein EOA64_00250 [Mesorhizobium sp. M1A.F.Ca.IN.022.02.1.1]RWI33434.1 MAG: hypothetical protein EOR13_17940 [Mesorhizobium sp.]